MKFTGCRTRRALFKRSFRLHQ